MSDKTQTSSIRFGSLLTLIFITLKLTNYINWSWWWVLSPIWIPTCIIVLVLGAMGIAGLIMSNSKY